MPPKASKTVTPAPSTPASGNTVRAPVVRANWSNEEVYSLVFQLKGAKDDGNTSENGFKSTVWSTIATTYEDPPKKIPRCCETKWSRLKKDFKEVKFLREASGFGWDVVKCVPTAEPEVWAEISQAVAPLLFVYDIYTNSLNRNTLRR